MVYDAASESERAVAKDGRVRLVAPGPVVLYSANRTWSVCGLEELHSDHTFLLSLGGCIRCEMGLTANNSPTTYHISDVCILEDNSVSADLMSSIDRAQRCDWVLPCVICNRRVRELDHTI